MKTTIDIPDALLEEAKKAAAREGTTVKALVERGLRRVLTEQRREAKFQLRRASFKGQGLQPEASGLSWNELRELAHKGRGA